MKTILFADDTILVQRYNNLEKLQNSIYCEMTNVIHWLTANKFSLNISETKYMLLTNKHANTVSFDMNVSGNHIERTLNYKYLGVIVDEKLALQENCQRLCSTISIYVGAMHKVKHYANNK